MIQFKLNLIILLLVYFLMAAEAVNKTVVRVELPTEASTPLICPAPSPQALRCLREWACQYVIRLDLRCLLSLNGNPLLGNLLGGSGITGQPAPGTGGGILGSILGR